MNASSSQYTRRAILVALLSAILAIGGGAIAFAQTTGAIAGTITDSAGGAPLARVSVTAVSPTGSYHAVTDSRGFFSLVGVSPDTYSLSLELAGYQSAASTGITVNADQTTNVTTKLARALRTLARVTSRAPSGAFQPREPLDTYSINQSQIETQLGKTFATSETQLLATIPGVTLDSSGYPVLRGGRENEEGFEFDGIDYTDAFTHQFVNSLALNGAGSLQLTPGGGDATSGNSGTGVINIIAKRGTYPAFGTLDLETQGAPFSHQFGLEYGFATPNGKLSNFVSFIGSRTAIQYGQYGADASSLNEYFGSSFDIGNDLVENLVYKFGDHNNQQIQFLYQNQSFSFADNYGGLKGLYYKSNDPYTLANINAYVPYLSTPQVQSVIGLFRGQQSPTQALNQYSIFIQPLETFKIQYSNNLDSGTFLTAKFYRVGSVDPYSAPFDSNQFSSINEYYDASGGERTGLAADATKQLGSKHLLQTGVRFDFLHPVNDFEDPMTGFLDVTGANFSGGGLEALDFLPNNANCPATAAVANPAPGYTPQCGYLSKYFPRGIPRIPAWVQTSTVNRQDYATYLQDTYTPTNRLKLNLGLRLDASNFQLPSTSSGLYDPNAYPAGSSVPSQEKSPFEVEPKGSVAYQIGKNDSVRFSFQRSVSFAPIADVDEEVNPATYDAFARIPSFDVQTGGVAKFCGVDQNVRCKSYADQLYWENQQFAGIPIQPAKPETFSNFDFSYAHQFPHDVSVKLTPFYRRGYDVLALTQSVIGNDINGVPILGPSTTTNLGINTTSGIEFYLVKDAQNGFSGSLNATYINEFSNVPPLSASEDFFPSIPPASLALGDLYRVGFLTPFQATAALQYKSRGGIRINPVIQYFRGYPLGAGSLTATSINNVNANVGQTNVTAPNGSPGASNYVCPTNPGTLFHPNICATRGYTEGASAGAFLSNATFDTNLTIEYSPPRTHSKFGVQINNLFNNLYNNANYELNGLYQPVAYGIAGPLTGKDPNAVNFPHTGFSNIGASAFGQAPFVNFPNATPLSVLLYYQASL